MKRAVIIYGIYVVFLLIFLGLMAATPMLAFSDMGGAMPLYSGFSYFCHQKLSRSTCLFEDNTIGDCTTQSGKYVEDDQKNLSATSDGVKGYKFPVCSRDVGLYLFMLIGAIAYALIFRLDEKRILPPVVLVLAIVPLAFDGGLQFLSDIGINLLGVEYESTNIVRLLTGGIAGFAVSLYVIPILNRMFG